MIIYGNIETEKSKFHYSKYLVNINNVDTEKLVISKKDLLAKRVLNVLLVTKMIEKLSHFV